MNASLVRAAGSAMAPAAVSSRRKKIALALAAVADVVQVGYFPIFGEGAVSPADDALDVVVALLLLVTLGFRWRLAVALAVELVPGATLLPTWTAVVLSLPSYDPAETSGRDARRRTSCASGLSSPSPSPSPPR